MRVFVEYNVPVLVEVDDQQGTVVSVRIDDECVDGPVGLFTEYELSEDDERRALAIAEANVWPAWDIGV